LKTEGTLTLTLSGAGSRGSLQSVLSPDNEGTPKGMKLEMEGGGKVLTFRLESASPSAVLSTLLAILRDVTLFQEVWLLSQGKGATVERAS